MMEEPSTHTETRPGRAGSTDRRLILRTGVDCASYQSAVETIMTWSEERRSRAVIAANVHVVMEAHDSGEFLRTVSSADLVVADGMPLVWALRALGARNATRVYGPTLTLHVCAAAAKRGIPVGLYGGTPDSIRRFEAFLAKRYPGIRIACSIAPPFRPLTPDEDEAFTNKIVRSGARIVFVGIGCPKQETWMAAHRDRIPAVKLGVGAAFDFHSGRVPQAPAWMQQIGLEWFFRLMHEPRRLWKRYLKHNPRFVALLGAQLVRSRKARVESRRAA